MKFDKLSLFSENQAVAAGANTTVYSKCVDLRANGQVGIDGMLKVYGTVVGTVNTGSLTTTLQTSADGASWTDVASETQNAMFLPCKGLKRFVRLKYAQGNSAIGSAVKVKAGLVDQFDQDDAPKVTDPFSATDPADLGEKIRAAEEKGIQLSSTSATTTKAAANSAVATVYVTNTIGTVTAAVTLSGSTSAHVTATKDSDDPTKWVIACTSSITEADYLVTFSDGFGNKAVFTVTGT